jgi:pimeloyl-ACP methyl ester carboxylesterase
MGVDFVNSAESVPRLFPSRDAELFGVYHAPGGASLRNDGVVLCYPGPQEYAQVHWAYQKLAKMLSAAGLHVLRFDYSSTGDSHGASADASLAQWSDDISSAASELRDVADIRRVSVVGMRLGGALALRAVANGLKVKNVVLWDPVVSGRDYLRSLDAAEDLRLGLLFFPESKQRVEDELMGYPFPARMRSETESVDLLTEPVGRVERALLVGARFSGAQLALQRRLEESGIAVTAARVDDPALYDEGRHPRDTILSHNIPVAITDFLTGRDR